MYKAPIVPLIVEPIEPPNQIKHVHSCVSYQWPIYQKYNWRGHESPSRYGVINCGDWGWGKSQ